jgi:hypothetical protein
LVAWVTILASRPSSATCSSSSSSSSSSRGMLSAPAAAAAMSRTGALLIQRQSCIWGNGLGRVERRNWRDPSQATL